MGDVCKVLECLDRVDNTLCLNNLKGKLEFGIDTEEHIDCDSVIGMIEDIENIKDALLELKAIKEIEPSEALNELYRIENNIIYSLRDCDISEEVSMNFNSIMEHNSCAIIKNYIIKTQKPKNYLKWDDLAFKEEGQTIKVLLNGSCYLLNYYTRSEEEFVFIKSTGTTIFNLLGECSDDKQLFNDLHLEVLE